MEKGEMRVEANISVSKTDSFGTKVEVKNLNSFKVVEKAIEYEIKRQSEKLERERKSSKKQEVGMKIERKHFHSARKKARTTTDIFPTPICRS